MSFSDLGLSAELLRAVSDQGYDTPTPIQAKAIPIIIAGHDVMASAQTGTGKTAAFTLPLLQRLGAANNGGKRRVRMLVLAPTRELADQVAESVRTYGRHQQLRTAVIYGGVNIRPQINALQAGVDIVVATPGRLIDHLDRRTVDLSAVETVVLDEADRMLDMGFIKPMERILGQVPKTRQTLLFSATFSDGIRKLAQRFLRSPEVIEVARNNSAAESVAQEAHWVDRGRKRELLSHLIGANNWRQVLVFTRTKRGADRLALQLSQDGIDAMAIHGDKSQGQRTRALAAFKCQRVRALVATDVAARGIDIDRLPHVVNYELPDNAEDYVHRIGRTGRGGQRGCAVSLVAGDERGQFTAIQKLVKGNLQATVVPGFEPTPGSDRAPRPEARRGKPRPSAPRAPRKGFAPKGAPRNGGQKPGRRASRKSV